MRDLPAMEIDQLGLITALFDCICMQIDWVLLYMYDWHTEGTSHLSPT